MPSPKPGSVLNRAALEPRPHYDFAIVGGGVLGLACAFYLRKLLPDASLLILEQGGVPSEEGATYVSPALLHRFYEDDGLRQQAGWMLETIRTLSEETGITRPHDVPFREVGYARLTDEATPDGLTVAALLESLPADARENLTALAAVEGFSHALYDSHAGYGNAEAIALHYGHGAVRTGADLLLNGRVTLEPNALLIERLEYNRFMRAEVVRRERVGVRTLILAAGAWTGEMLEGGLGIRSPYKRVYMQYPRIETTGRLKLAEGRVEMPVLELYGFTLRPQGEGVLLVPPPLPPDPKGYEPTGGDLMGVRVGLRRELMEGLLEAEPFLPCVAWDSLNLGKTVANVRGAWEVVTPKGLPEWRRLEEHYYTLVGGRQGLTLGLSAAYDLAATLAGVKGRPWD